ncbi:MAG TPA: TIM barrel protein [Propionibacteriaceae bacterium]|nr:TIM barrel protein [Propionibacteriaceae bacterium]
MLVGLSSYTFPWAVGVRGWPPARPLQPLELLHRAVELGVGVVQFADNLPLDELDEPELSSVEAFAGEHGIQIELGTRGVGEQLTRCADLAVRLGSPFVRVVIDKGDDEPTIPEAIARLSGYEDAYRARGLRLAIENHDRFTSRQLLDIVDALGDWAAICLDTVNSLGALEPPEQVLAALGPRAINVHLKDFTIQRHRHALGFEVIGTPLGQGRLDLPRLLRSLEAWGRVQTAILELWTPLEESLDSTIAKERSWAIASLSHLRASTSLEFASTAS